ncbi:protein of unknown function [Paraburkholderia kururiensis]|uniref:hypothetical protein n=1 Tax=Paraburkholderia kururiensis TaxID=984307 RepID=UPI001591751E|nr:hypothetical protein [Paraburkholderia kururiensis]
MATNEVDAGFANRVDAESRRQHLLDSDLEALSKGSTSLRERTASVRNGPHYTQNDSVSSPRVKKRDIFLLLGSYDSLLRRTL